MLVENKPEVSIPENFIDICDIFSPSRSDILRFYLDKFSVDLSQSPILKFLSATPSFIKRSETYKKSKYGWKQEE